MTKIEKKKIVENLIDTFLYAGRVSLDLRNQGLKKEVKADNTPVSNGDIEVNKIIINKIKELTPHIPIISEETSENKNINDLNNFWLIDPIDGTFDYINNLDEFIKATVDKIYDENSDQDFFSAIKLCKKKRIGPARTSDNRPLFYKKDISLLARNGFDFETSKKVMDIEKEDYLKIIGLL